MECGSGAPGRVIAEGLVARAFSGSCSSWLAQEQEKLHAGVASLTMLAGSAAPPAVPGHFPSLEEQCAASAAYRNAASDAFHASVASGFAFALPPAAAAAAAPHVVGAARFPSLEEQRAEASARALASSKAFYAGVPPVSAARQSSAACALRVNACGVELCLLLLLDLRPVDATACYSKSNERTLRRGCLSR